ncbi:MAG: hypothetical protein OXT74_13475, partial [Candidatus Poribacteria bacterium]|nr:hypothetical protein [Candidatus Poribacteria bacterium]
MAIKMETESKRDSAMAYNPNKNLQNTLSEVNVEDEIVITETENEFHLKIPANQRTRAKKIEGREWKPTLKRWVYPRSMQTFNALVAEFQSDLSSSSSFTSPELSPNTETAKFRLEKETGSLKAKIKALETEVNEKNLENKGLKKRLAHFEASHEINITETAALKTEIVTLKAVAVQRQQDDENLHRRHIDLQEENAKHQEEIDSLKARIEMYETDSKAKIRENGDLNERIAEMETEIREKDSVLKLLKTIIGEKEQGEMESNGQNRPNRDALDNALSIYRDTMRPFVARCLKQAPNLTDKDRVYVEDEDEMDIKEFASLIRNYWYVTFESHLDPERKGR